MFILQVIFLKIQAPEDLALCYHRGPPKTKLTSARPQVVQTHLTACVPFKILETLIHIRIYPVVDPQLSREQAGFRLGRSTVDQVTLLTQDIEDSFQHNEKAGVEVLDLTAAYNTMWHRGLYLKLLNTIPDRHNVMVGFIMEMLSNRSVAVHTSDGQRSMLRIMKNGVPQGSILSPISDFLESTSKKVRLC